MIYQLQQYYYFRFKAGGRPDVRPQLSEKNQHPGGKTIIGSPMGTSFRPEGKPEKSESRVVETSKWLSGEGICGFGEGESV